METLTLPAITALWLGILTSVSPCPLASNIAAVAFISRDFKKKSSVLWAGGSYVAGRIFCYAALGACISASLINVPLFSHYSQMYMPKVIGPILVLTGIVLLDLIPLPFSGLIISQASAQRLRAFGAPGALLLGVLFAFAFCPVSAALFFGSLIPLAVANKSPVFYSLIFGLGTGLPVIGTAFAIACGVKRASVFFQKVTAAERIIRLLTAGVMLLVGIYYIAKYILLLQLW